MRRMTHLNSALLIGSMLAGACAVLTSNFAAAEDTVRIGFSMPRTGFLGVAAPVAENAYDLWRDQVNARGGLDIGGKGKRKIEFVTYDDQSEPSKAAQIYQKLIAEDKVDLLLAPYATPFHIAIAPVAEKNKFPIVGAAASSTLLRDLKVKYMWFAEDLTEDFGKELPKFMKSVGLKSVSLMTLQLPFSLEIKRAAVPGFKEQGIELMQNDEYPPDIKDMTGMLSGVKKNNPDAVIGLSYPEDSILYVNTAKEVGIAPKMQLLLIGPSEAYFAQKFPGKGVEGMMTIGHWSPKQAKWPKAKPFYDAYVAKFHEAPDYLDTVITYMSAEILEQAVAKVGLDHEKIRETIASTTFDTINGPVKFDGVRNVTTPAGLLQYQNGEMEIVWPKEIATSSFKPGWSPQ
jgi:branched-chain amino acid transport system substrate-binding protein